MKALTLTQPWATLVAIGAKKIETRSWNTKYRGRLAIHSAKGYPGWAKDTCYQPEFKKALQNAGYSIPHELPTGVIVAICKIARIDNIKDGYSKYKTADERAFGDYTPGRFAWILEDVEMLSEPIAAKGALGLWNWQKGQP